MAPYSSHKKQVKFAKSRTPRPYKTSPNSADSYANIVLHCLSKLKGFFQTRSDDKEPTRYNRLDTYDISKPILKKDQGSFGDFESQRKAYDIVNAALQYGCANDIIEKVGDYFLVKNKSNQRTNTRRPTPGPDYIRCASCKNLEKFPNKHSIDDPISSRMKKRRRYNDDDDDYSRRRSRSSTSVVNYCSKCYARMKSNRR